MVSHILGGTDIDGKGIAGIEKSFNEKLLNGENITISIHNGIQYITEKIMSEQIKKFDAEGGAGIVMNAKNGEIYAITSLPDYNANNYNKILDKKLFNKATKGTYELGSTLKLITAAVALDHSSVTALTGTPPIINPPSTPGPPVPALCKTLLVENAAASDHEVSFHSSVCVAAG